MSPNIDTVVTSTNMMAKFTNITTLININTSTDMADYNISILINSSTFQDPQYYPVPQESGYCFLSNMSVNSNDDNEMKPIV